MPPDATNEGFSGPLLRLHSASIAPGGHRRRSAPATRSPAPSQKNGLDFEIIFEAEPTTGPAPSGPTLSNSLTASTSTTGSRTRSSALPSSTWTRCSPITTAVDILYTMDHELVRGWQLSLSTSAVIPGGTPTLPGLGVITNPPTQTETVRGGNGSVHLNTGTWPHAPTPSPSAALLKLTDGENDDSGRSPMVAIFCKH